MYKTTQIDEKLVGLRFENYPEEEKQRLMKIHQYDEQSVYVVLQKHKNSKLQKNCVIIHQPVKKTSTIQFLQKIVRYKVDIKETESIYIYDDKKLLKQNTQMQELVDQQRVQPDGILYLYYYEQETMG